MEVDFHILIQLYHKPYRLWFRSSESIFGANGIPPVSIITSMISTISAIFLGLSITISLASSGLRNQMIQAFRQLFGNIDLEFALFLFWQEDDGHHLELFV